MAAENVARKLIRSHLVEGRMEPGEEIAIRIDQTLTQDATGTLVMLELEGMGLDRVRTELSAQYVDHNIVQEDFKNADDHLFLRSAAQRFGIHYSRPGNGVSHPVHQECFGQPGKTLLGSDSHTPAAGAIGMLAMGAGGLEVAMAMAGEPYHLKMPAIWGVRLEGELPDWVSAKDVILEMLRRHGVRGGVGRIIEYHGPGLDQLQVMDRHVLGNMGTELGATTTVFPADDEVRRFMRAQGRDGDFRELAADPGATYDVEEVIDLSKLEPLVALPTSPGNVVPVREVAGRPIYQVYIGSSANPGYRDLAVVADIVKGRTSHDNVSFDVNPASRQSLAKLIADGHLLSLTAAGARIHQTGCNGCIGMGQAPATDRISLRTVPRNFPGRSGTREDQVYLVSPETAAASALQGVITDPRSLGVPYPKVREPYDGMNRMELITPPLPPEEAARVELVRGPNIQPLPELEALPKSLAVPVLLKAQDDISTDEILPPGARVLPFRSNIPKIAEFSFDRVDPTYYQRAMAIRDKGGHVVVGGNNYGQGSSREHAALAPRFLGLRAVIAKGFARIHAQNLVNFGVAPLLFVDPKDYDTLSQGDRLELTFDGLQEGYPQVRSGARAIEVRHELSARQLEILRAGGLVNWMRARIQSKPV